MDTKESYMQSGKIKKGDYGYIASKKKAAIVRTLILFALSLALLGIGIWSSGSKKNLLTIVAVLGCLPASKSAVGMILLLKAKGCSKQVKDQVKKYHGNFTVLYDMVFTSYDRIYQVSHMVVEDNLILGLTEDQGWSMEAGEKHLLTYLRQGGCTKATVKLYQNLDTYCKALESLESKKQEERGMSPGIPASCEEVEDHEIGSQSRLILENLMDISL